MRGVTSKLSALIGVSLFQPALPMRGVTGTVSSSVISSCVFQPALPMRGVTEFESELLVGSGISTRTPHAGSDRNIMCKFTASINI